MQFLGQGAVEYVRFIPSAEGILDQCSTARQGKSISNLRVVSKYFVKECNASLRNFYAPLDG